MSDELMDIVGKTYPKKMFHRIKSMVTVSDKTEEAKMVAEGYTTRYLHQEYPLTMYHNSKRDRDGNSVHKVVNSQREEEALGPDWLREPQSPLIVDKIPEEIDDKHVHYLQSKGFRISDVEGAIAYYTSLNDEMQQQFLQDVIDWDPTRSAMDLQSDGEGKKKKRR